MKHIFGGLTGAHCEKQNSIEIPSKESKIDHIKTIKNTESEGSNLVMLCWQNYSGVRMAKLIPHEKYDLTNDEDFSLKISTMGLFFPAYKDVMVHGLKFTNAPR